MNPIHLSAIFTSFAKAAPKKKSPLQAYLRTHGSSLEALLGDTCKRLNTQTYKREWFGGREISNIAYSLAKVGKFDGRFFDLVVER